MLITHWPVYLHFVGVQVRAVSSLVRRIASNTEGNIPLKQKGERWGGQNGLCSEVTMKGWRLYVLALMAFPSSSVFPPGSVRSKAWVPVQRDQPVC